MRSMARSASATIERTMSPAGVSSWMAPTPGHDKCNVEDAPRPVAQDEAREERLKAVEAAARVCREDAEINAARAEKAEAALKEAEARANTATVACEVMRARAEKAEREVERLRAKIGGAP